MLQLFWRRRIAQLTVLPSNTRIIANLLHYASGTFNMKVIKSHQLTPFCLTEAMMDSESNNNNPKTQLSPNKN